MEQFRTELNVVPMPMIHHGLSILTTGSCFSDNIGQKLSESKFRAVVNPLGACYNPISIHKALMMSAPDDDLFVESQGTWRHFDFHSKFAAGSRDDVRKKINARLSMRTSDVVMITYGTAWVYRHKATNKIVANCHKRPQAEFEKILLTVDDIVTSFKELKGVLDKKIIITLSPVRHLKDSLELNSISKSIVRHAIYHIHRTFPDVDYFPAYEIMMDDLRDYRFYDADMIHPTDVAIDYIWNKFGERYFSKETKEINDRWKKIARSINHKVFNEGTGEHKTFLQKIRIDLEELKKDLDVSREIEEIENRINA